MLFKFPKDDKHFSWTSHVKGKMMHYRLSEQKIRTILRSNDRKEVGIAPQTLAVMKRNDSPRRKEELWVMYMETRNEKLKTRKTRIISAWRYPGISPKNREIPVPEDILSELEALI